MNKKIMIVSVIVISAIGGSFAFLLTRSQDEPAPSSVAVTPAPAAVQPSTPEASQPSAGEYKDYSPTAIAEAQGTKLLFFHAPWCPQCRALEADIKSKEIPTGVTIFKVDFDTNQSLRKQYGVTLQTTIVKLDDSNNLVEKFVAYDDPTLQAIKENIL